MRIFHISSVERVFLNSYFAFPLFNTSLRDCQLNDVNKFPASALIGSVSNGRVALLG